jgi:hypothetical protein
MTVCCIKIVRDVEGEEKIDEQQQVIQNNNCEGGESPRRV